jgi:predicted RNA-binding Zn-ribbon protein involved in translation (DUF1610 family)
MATSVVCHSCGHRIGLEEGFARRKVRCPECGVMCEVTEVARAAPAESRPARRAGTPSTPLREEQEAEELARQLWTEPEPQREQPLPEPEPPRPVRRRAAAPPSEELPSDRPSIPSPESSRTWTEEDEDSNPYDVATPLRFCPECRRELEPQGILCVYCGLDLRSGKRRVQEFEPLHRQWEPGMPGSRRWALFVALSAGSLLLSILSAVMVGPWYVSAGPWAGFVVMMAFLLGTYDRIELVRDRRGLTRLTRTWYICFIQRPTTIIDLRHYESVVTGRSLDSGCLEWLIFFLLFPYFIVPGIIWWYHVIHKTKFHTALAHSHNYPEIILYRGNNPGQAEEIAATLRDAARLHYDRG